MKSAKKRRETNVEFITRIMEYGCPTGVLVQPFIIEAIGHYAHRYSTEPIMEGGLIDPEAWMETAQFVREELKKKYDKS
jgi:hypothetical protein